MADKKLKKRPFSVFSEEQIKLRHEAVQKEIEIENKGLIEFWPFIVVFLLSYFLIIYFSNITMWFALIISVAAAFLVTLLYFKLIRSRNN